MRKLGFTFFILGLLLPKVLIGQAPCNNRLVFSEAFFLELKSDKSRDFTAIDSTVQVDQGKVWMISAVKAYRISNDFYPTDNAISVWINDQVIHHYRSEFVGPIWLPAGKYRIRLHTDDKSENDNFRAYISGVQYMVEL
ncbi:MAG: hypothetical protein V2B15_08225 [Bacteroidota bacterium]